MSVATADWQPYTPQLARPGAKPALVEMRDATGRDQQVTAPIQVEPRSALLSLPFAG